MSANSKPVAALPIPGTGGHQKHYGLRATTTAPQHSQITRWPVSHHNAGVLILSDDEDDEDEDEN